MKFKIILFYFLIGFSFASCDQVQKKNDKFIIPLGYNYKNSNVINSAKGDVGNFSLIDNSGNYYELYRYADYNAVVIVSLNFDCPISLEQSIRLNQIRESFSKHKIQFFYLNSNPSAERDFIFKEGAKRKFTFPVLMDKSQTVLESLFIHKSSEIVVLSPKNWKIVFRGGVVESLKDIENVKLNKKNNLVETINMLSKNFQVDLNQLESNGCPINFNQNLNLSFKNSIAPILKSKCITCHSKEEGYLPNLDKHEKILNWLEMIKETIMTDRMPPFSVDHYYGNYKNDISLTAEEKRLLITWLKQGAPKDTSSDDLIIKNSSNSRQKLAKHYSEIKPIYSVTMEPQRIAPGGENEYVYIQLGDAIPNDMWIEGGWTFTDNPRQVHHSSLMVTSKPLSFYKNLSDKLFHVNPNEKKLKVDGDIFVYLLYTLEKYERQSLNENFFRFMVWGAGKPQPFSFKNKGFIFFPKGSYLILETHYMGTGKEDTEKTSINFYGTNFKPYGQMQIKSHSVASTNFSIPPNVSNFEVVTPEWKVPKNILINYFNGHLHMRGKSVKVEEISLSGDVKTIFSIPNFYYGWQTGSGVEPLIPIFVSKGHKLRVRCYYDNSAQNPFNPDPSKIVKWGQRVDRTEMCKMNLTFTFDKNYKR